MYSGNNVIYHFMIVISMGMAESSGLGYVLHTAQFVSQI